MGNADMTKDITLALFFTCGVSLKKWHDLGIIDREAAIYNRLSSRLKHIYFFTYGGREDTGFSSHLSENITVIPVPFLKSSDYGMMLTPFIWAYSFLLPFIRYRSIMRADIIKTNQMKGSWTAVIAKIFFRKRLMLRTGYVWSLSKYRSDPASPKIKLIKLIERLAYSFADVVTVSSMESREYIKDNFRPKAAVSVLPNYIDTDLFKPSGTKKAERSLCFVGRLSDEKNLFSLLEAVSQTGCSITIVGRGGLEYKLKSYAEANGVRAAFPGIVGNNDLPELLNRHEAFILPSLYEGMPKALLEAMACGLACIGTDVQGIREVISHRENGYLCRTDAASIRDAISEVMDDSRLRSMLGEKARDKILSEFSLTNISQRELELYASM